MTRPDLFPRPRHVEWGDQWAPPGTPIAEQHDPALPTEGYRLTVGTDRIELVTTNVSSPFEARMLFG